MATTPNYGWVTPAPTDFVTDLPADFETFADAVDADLAGLLGGTTGQILTKDSNADHDFSWTTASGLSATIFDAKGDLIAASAADTAARLAVGINGQVLTADSGETTGLKWGNVGYTLLSTNTVTNGVTTYSVSSIPTTYKHLHIFFQGIHTSIDGTEINLRLNGITTTSYSFAGFSGQNYADNDTTSIYSFGVGTTATTTRHRLHGDLFLPNYTTTGVAQANIRTFSRTNAGVNNWTSINANFTNAAAISQITILPVSGNLQGGTILIYGVN